MLDKLFSGFKFKHTNLTLKEKVVIALPKQAYNLSTVIIHNVFIKYYTDIIGLKPVYVSLIYLIFNVWNYLNDPVIGIMLDKMKYRKDRGKYAYVMRVTFPVMIVMLTLMLFSSPNWDQWLIFAVLTGALFLFDTAGTFYVISIDSYSMLAAPSKEERVDISMIGNYLSYIFSFFATLIPTLLLVGNLKNNRPLVISMLLLVIVLNAVLYIMAALMIEDKEEYYLTGDSSEVEMSYETLKEDVLSFARMREFWAFFTFKAITFGPQAIYFTVFLYYMDYVIKSTGFQATLADVLPMLLLFAIYPLIGKKIKDIGVKSSLLMVILPYIIGYVILYTSQTWYVVLLSYIPILLGRLVNETVQYPIGGMIIDENERLTGVRKPGLFSAVNSILFAPLSGIQLVLFMTIIDQFGFRNGGVEQSARAIQGIRIAGALVPIIFVLVGVIPILLLPINLEKENELSEYSIERRSGGEE